MKRRVGCTELATGQSEPYKLFLQRSGNIKCTITGARCCSSVLLQDGLEIPCTLRFSGDAKAYKLNASKILILI